MTIKSFLIIIVLSIIGLILFNDFLLKEDNDRLEFEVSKYQVYVDSLNSRIDSLDNIVKSMEMQADSIINVVKDEESKVKKVKERYNEKIDSIISLPLDSSILFLARRLSEVKVD